MYSSWFLCLLLCLRDSAYLFKAFDFRATFLEHLLTSFSYLSTTASLGRSEACPPPDLPSFVFNPFLFHQEFPPFFIPLPNLGFQRWILAVNFIKYKWKHHSCCMSQPLFFLVPRNWATLLAQFPFGSHVAAAGMCVSINPIQFCALETCIIWFVGHSS